MIKPYKTVEQVCVSKIMITLFGTNDYIIDCFVII